MEYGVTFVMYNTAYSYTVLYTLQYTSTFYQNLVPERYLYAKILTTKLINTHSIKIKFNKNFDGLELL